MLETMGLSKVALENIIFQKLSARLKQIKWGENCHSLLEGLTFAEEWLFEGIKELEGRKKFKNYLFSEGFALKVVKRFGKETVFWTFPSKSRKPLFIKVSSDYTTSYANAVKAQSSLAHREIANFIETEGRFTSYCLENSIFKKYLLEAIGKYNQELLRAKNMLTAEDLDEYDYIDFRFTKHEDVIFLSKSHSFYGFIEQAEISRDMAFENALKAFLQVVNVLIASRAMVKMPNKFVTAISANYFEDFKNVFEPHGISVSLMPKYPDKEYYLVLQADEYQIPVYLEVVHVNTDNNEYQLNELRNFCRAFAN